MPEPSHPESPPSAPDPAARPSWPSIALLREVSQPPHVRTRAAAEHWTGHLYMRHISPYLTRIFLALGLSANAVTWLMVVAAALAGVATGWPTFGGALLVLVLVQLQMYIDACDGEVARWRQTFSPLGIYLDRVGHYVAECGIAVGLGVRVAGGLGDLDSRWIAAGLALALLIGFNKVENDLVHVARHYNQMTQVRDAEDVRMPARGALRTAKRLVRFFPFHRIFHSVEMSILIFLAAVVDLVAGVPATRWLLLAMLISACITVIGHLAAILNSSRLT